MPHYIRAWVPGGTFFLTIVTLDRRKIFQYSGARRILGKAVNRIIRDYLFSLDAWVLMPDHIHTIWTLPEGDTNYGKIGVNQGQFFQSRKELVA
jgi:putative transposase